MRRGVTEEAACGPFFQQLETRLLLNGTGFGPQQDISLSPADASCVHATDLDGDGDADVEEQVERARRRVRGGGRGAVEGAEGDGANGDGCVGGLGGGGGLLGLRGGVGGHGWAAPFLARGGSSVIWMARVWPTSPGLPAR